MIRRESQLSVVPVFLRLEKAVLLSNEVDKDPVLDPLLTEGDRAAKEDNFGTTFLVEPLLPVLSNDVDSRLLIEVEGDDELDDAFGVAAGDAGTDFLVSEIVDRVKDLPLADGSELRLISGSDLLTGSGAEEVGFFATTEFTLVVDLLVTVVGCLSGKPPVLFLLATGTPVELLEALLRVGFVNVDDLNPQELDSAPFIDSAFFPNPAFFILEFCFTFLVVFTSSADDCFCGFSTLSSPTVGFSNSGLCASSTAPSVYLGLEPSILTLQL
nr:hypothetical protein AQUCO_12000026v1 [Ipomoea batatas]